MICYVIVDCNGNVFGVADSVDMALYYKNKLLEKDATLILDYIECPMNEVILDGEVIR